jgi:hypothetical protein
MHYNPDFTVVNVFFHKAGKAPAPALPLPPPDKRAFRAASGCLPVRQGHFGRKPRSLPATPLP